MTKENFIKELQTFKDDCKSLEAEFKPMWKKLKEIRNRALKFYKEMNANKSLYANDEFKKDVILPDGWDFGMFHRCDDIVEYIPQSIETIDTCLHNVRMTKVKTRKSTKKEVCNDCY